MKLNIKSFNSVKGSSLIELAVGIVLLIMSSVGFVSYMGAQAKTQMFIQLNIANNSILLLEEDRARNFDIEDYQSIGGTGKIIHKLKGLTENDDRFFSVITFELILEEDLIEGSVASMVHLIAEVMELRNDEYMGLGREIIHEKIVVRN
jgi:hypothetical protein